MENDNQHMNTHNEHIRGHWKLTLIGSAVGFGAVIAEMLYYFAVNRIGKFIGDDIFEIGVNFAILFIFLLFLHAGIVEYEDIKDEIRMRKSARTELPLS